jgi:short-subunit dehydrogenase
MTGPEAARLGTAIVTGSTGDVGAGYARGLADRGYDLLLVGRSKPALDELADDIGKSRPVRVDTAACDLARSGELDRLLIRLRNDVSLALLANIAGAATYSPFGALSPAALGETIAVNCTALSRLIHAVVPGFLQRGRGTVVNFASILAFRPWPEFNVYNASKAFVVALSQSLQGDLGKQGILVQVVAPPVIATRFWSSAGFGYENLPASAVMPRDDFVRAALLGLDRREEWVFPSLADPQLLDSFQKARADLVVGMMKGKVAERYLAR